MRSRAREEHRKKLGDKKTGDSAPGSARISDETRAALRRAAKDGDVGALTKLLDEGAPVNTVLDAYDLTPLHYAAWRGHVGAVHLLISRGAAIEAQNRDGKTALHLCAGNGKAAIVKALVRQGASLTAKDKDAHTPLDIGELWGNVEASAAIRQAAHEKLAKDAGKQWKWRAQSVGKLEQPKRIASYIRDGVNDDWKVQAGFAAYPKHHLSVQRVGVHPCTEAWQS